MQNETHVLTVALSVIGLSLSFIFVLGTFMLKDLYRRLLSVENDRTVLREKMIEIQAEQKTNTKMLESIALDVKSISLNCVVERRNKNASIISENYDNTKI
jgi:hypothetical protein